MATRPAVLLVVLPPSHHSHLSFKEHPHKAQRDLATATEAIHRAGFSDFEVLELPPEQGPLAVDELVEKLKQKDWRGICFGSDLRSELAITAWFERLVQVAVATSPKAWLLFNSSPSDTLDAIERNFPKEEVA